MMKTKVASNRAAVGRANASHVWYGHCCKQIINTEPKDMMRQASIDRFQMNYCACSLSVNEFLMTRQSNEAAELHVDVAFIWIMIGNVNISPLPLQIQNITHTSGKINQNWAKGHLW